MAPAVRSPQINSDQERKRGVREPPFRRPLTSSLPPSSQATLTPPQFSHSLPVTTTLPNGVCVKAPTGQTCPRLVELQLLSSSSLRPSAAFSFPTIPGWLQTGKASSQTPISSPGHFHPASRSCKVCTAPPVSEGRLGGDQRWGLECS